MTKRPVGIIAEGITHSVSCLCTVPKRPGNRRCRLPTASASVMPDSVSVGSLPIQASQLLLHCFVMMVGGCVSWIAGRASVVVVVMIVIPPSLDLQKQNVQNRHQNDNKNNQKAEAEQDQTWRRTKDHKNTAVL